MTRDGEVRGLDAATGETRWSVSIGKHARFLATTRLDGTLYAVCRQVGSAEVSVEEEFSRLYRIDPKTGSFTNLGDLPGDPHADWVVTAAGDSLYLARDDGVVFAYDADATERWRTDLRTGEETATPHFPEGTEHEPVPTAENATSEGLNIQFGGVADGRLYVGVRGGVETIYALAVDGGEIRWETSGYHVVEAAGVDRVLVSGGGELRGFRYAALDPKSGAEQWTRVIERGNHNWAPGLTTGGVLYAPLEFADDTATLLALDASTGETLAEPTLDGIGLLTPVVVDGTLVFATRKRDGGSLRATPPIDPSG